MRYTLLIETADADALVTAIALFTDIHAAPSHAQSNLTELTFTATDDALDAYLDRFGLDRDERDDVFMRVD